MDVRKELSIACCECLNCTGGKVGILSAEPLSLPSQELNINHLRRRKAVLIKLQRCFNVRVSVSDGYQLSENASETQIDTTIHCTYCKHRTKRRISGMESPLHSCWDKITVKNRRGGGSLAREGGFRKPWNPPLAMPLNQHTGKVMKYKKN